MALSTVDNIPTEEDSRMSVTHEDTLLGIEAENNPSISGNDKKVTKASCPPLHRERMKSLRSGSTSARPQYHL
ncbi:hypothetical protein JTB14_014752 [Gonioctena quinquepunctata]|nr:hypothetical protein JTB14_014752 [Gonioctena quinquepunctata]